MTILQWTNITSVISKLATFSAFSYLVILLLVFPSNFIASGVKSSGKYLVFILNVILFSILYTYIIIEWLSVTVSCYFKIYLK